ncbi:hypothetical protein AYI68_g7880 [Smittium mucronatum]|uniref:Nucleoporin nup82 n=1 Tax=Smittium mucronatum TaxID=133383 RepID=A0A1R0GMF2_9FUNG|nr:hypothetical protein AYI68_g7880 [Smittium mucronatum]
MAYELKNWINFIGENDAFKSTASSSVKSVEKISSRIKNKILAINTFLIISVNNQIRVLDLIRVKENVFTNFDKLNSLSEQKLTEESIAKTSHQNLIDSIKGVPYLTILSLESNSEIIEISINKSKQMLAVLSTDKVFAISIDIGAWERIFDVSLENPLPEQVVPLTDINGDSLISSKIAVSFAIGKGSMSGWERVTTYVLTNDGDIYSISPFVPKECIIEKNWIEDLLTISEAEVEELQSEQYFVNKTLICPPKLQDAIRSNEWVNSVYKIISEMLSSNNTENNTSNSSVLNIVIPTKLLRGIKFSGPFSLNPSPPEIFVENFSDSCSYSSEDQIDDACDLVLLSSNPISMLVVSYYGSRVNLFGIVEPPFPKWELKTPESAKGCKTEYPSLLTLESINFGSEDWICAGPTSLTLSDISQDTVFVMNSIGIFKLQTSNWTQEFKRRLGYVSSCSENPSAQEKQTDNLEKLVTKLIKGKSDMNSDNDEISEYFSKLSVDSSDSDMEASKAKAVIECLLDLEKFKGPRFEQRVIGFTEIIDVYVSYSAIAMIDDRNDESCESSCVVIGFSMMMIEEELNLLSLKLANKEKIKALKDTMAAKIKTADVKTLLSNENKKSNQLDIVSLEAMISSIDKFELSVPGYESRGEIEKIKKVSIAKDYISKEKEKADKVLSSFGEKKIKDKPRKGYGADFDSDDEIIVDTEFFASLNSEISEL